MLWIWLFAVAAPVVNACTLDRTRPASDDTAMATAMQHAQDAVAHARHTASSRAPHASTDGHAHLNPAPCAKFCDEPNTGAQEPQFDSHALPWMASGMLVPVASRWGLHEAPPARGNADAGLHAIPISIAFLRLAL